MQKCNENAANRYSHVGEVYNVGERERKQQILKSLKPEWSELHEKGYIHIHDLDAYGLTYNCLTFDILRDFPYESFEGLSDAKKITGAFDYLRKLFADIGNEQSGGMALANFDNDYAIILKKLGIKFTTQNKETISASICNLISWCNDTHTRMGQTSYYVTLNIGLAITEEARFIAFTLLDEFEKMGDFVFKPNIIFKVNNKLNAHIDAPNYDLYQKSLLCTAKKMIPTYLLCDSIVNKDVSAEKIAVMGCRTRVVADVYGESSSIGRGNIDNISINLPRLALESAKARDSIDERISLFVQKWDMVAKLVKDILLDRFNKVCTRAPESFPINKKHHIWKEEFEDVKNVFRHGTLSIGFIGLSEAFEVLTGKRFYEDIEIYTKALDFVKHMRKYCDFLREEYRLNFSLLATSGELISGRFVELDERLYSGEYAIFEKGFYTNSFHVNVDSRLTGFRKIQLEALFHEVCNGGCITYVELGEAPLGNEEGLQEYINFATKSGVHYLGFNFPKDVCNKCGASGVFDECSVCESKDITRIRRVSGYLEVLDGFTTGKKNEEKNRRAN